MKLKEAFEPLMEAPLPDDWDADIFNPRIPFRTRVEYAKQRAEYVAQGSSRIAYKIPYEGRDTVLKIAKNRKGMAQNAVEARTMDDWYLRTLGLFVPIIDYDEKSSTPTWLHFEYAEPVKDSDFVRETGVYARDLVKYAEIVVDGVDPRRPMWAGQTKPSGINEDSELVQDFVSFYGNYGGKGSVNISDYTNPKNWGRYRGKLVIVDIGLSDSVYHKHYRR